MEGYAPGWSPVIGYLRGRLLAVEENRILLDVGGVGYEVTLVPRLLPQLPAAGEEVELYTHLNVREDALQLFGFSNLQERGLFRLLLKAQGIGPRVALTILDTFQGKELSTLIAAGDLEALQRVPGVGKKSAQRLILDLKGKLPEIDGRSAAIAGDSPVLTEVAEGLLALGYNRQEAEMMVKKLSAEELGRKSADQLLRIALKDLGRGKR